MNRKMLSILCITYNHERYIAQAIESMLMQKTNFDVEIVIGEDCSTDKTREICIDYHARNPEKIKLLLNEKNLGAIPNFIQTLNACQGKYVALLEGDDYWIAPHKLQKQVDFLESNPDYVICHHRYYTYNKEHNRNSLSAIMKDTISIEDLARDYKVRTLTCVFSNILKEMPAWLLRSPVGDYPLFMILAQYGKIKFLNEPMAVYNIHPGGECNKKNPIEQMKTDISIKELMYQYGNFADNVRDILWDSILDRNLQMIQELFRAGQTDEIPSILNKLESNYSKSDLVKKLYSCQQEIIAIEKYLRSTYSYRIGKFITKKLKKLGFFKKFQHLYQTENNKNFQ